MSVEEKTECYQCGDPVYELSLRSRCVSCEHQRADYNEAENERIREAAHNVIGAYKNVQSSYRSNSWKGGDELISAIVNLKTTLGF
jgi:hypothetical protein